MNCYFAQSLGMGTEYSSVVWFVEPFISRPMNLCNYPNKFQQPGISVIQAGCQL